MHNFTVVDLSLPAIDTNKSWECSLRLKLMCLIGDFKQVSTELRPVVCQQSQPPVILGGFGERPEPTLHPPLDDLILQSSFPTNTTHDSQVGCPYNTNTQDFGDGVHRYPPLSNISPSPSPSTRIRTHTHIYTQKHFAINDCLRK